MINRLFMLCLCCALSITASALEIVDNATYLENKFRAKWRSTPLSEVLKEIEKQTVLISVSESVDDIQNNQQVTLIDYDKVSLRETLKLIERTQELHFIAEPLRLIVKTTRDIRDDKRHSVILKLQDYGIFVQKIDFPGPRLGFPVKTSSKNSDLHEMEDIFVDNGLSDPDLVLERLHAVAEEATLELRGHNIFMHVTDQEEAAIRASLERIQHQLLKRSMWHITFGTLPTGEKLVTGMTSAAEAKKLIPRLQLRRELSLSAFSGQRTHAINGHQQSLISDIDVIASHYDPVMTVLNTGVAADLRPTIGSIFNLVTYRLFWVDPLPTSISKVTNPARITGQSTTTTATTTAEDEKTTPANPQDETTENLSTTQTNKMTTRVGDVRPETTIPITKPKVWAWMPKGEIMLPKDYAMVFATEHPTGTAVIILEALP